MKTSLTILCICLLNTRVCAQPMSLADFNQRFEQELGKITQQHKEQNKNLNVKYLGALIRLEMQAKKQGNLDLVQAVRAEAARIDQGGYLLTSDKDVPPELRDMQKVMEKLRDGYRTEEAKAVVNLVDNLKTYAEARSTESTRQNNISQAVAWRDWGDSLAENDVIREAYARTGKSGGTGSHREANVEKYHRALKGRPAKIHEQQAKEFADSPRVFRSGFEPKGAERRIQNASTPSAKGAGNTKLTAQVLLIDEDETLSKDRSYWSSYKKKSHTYVPRLKMSPLIGKSLDRCLVVFDLYKRGSGSKRSIIRTDSILLPPLAADDNVVVDAGSYYYETEKYDSSYSSYDYKSSTADEFYGYIVTIFDKDGEMIYQRTTERILTDYAREAPPE